MTKRIMDVIRNEALRENAMLKKKYGGGHNLVEPGKNSKKVIEKNENMSFQPLFRAPFVRMSENPITLTDLLDFNPDIRQTYGHFTIKYVPQARRTYVHAKAYQIITDLLGFVPTVSGPKHLNCLCERIPELKWMIRNTNFNNDLFAIAKRHPGTPFVFSVDWSKYGNMIIEKAKEKNIDIDNKPFVAYRTTEEKMEEMSRTYKLAPVLTKEDCAGIVGEVAEEFIDDEE